MQRVRATGTLDSLPPAALSHSAQDFSVARRGGFIDPRNRADFGSTKRDCESAVSTSSQKAQRIDAAYPEPPVSEAAKSIVGFRNFGKASVSEEDSRSNRAGFVNDDAHERNDD